MRHIGDFVGSDSAGGKCRGVKSIDTGGITGGDEHGLGVGGRGRNDEEVEYRVDRETEARVDFSVAYEHQSAMRRSAGEQIAVGKTTQGEDMGFANFEELARGDGLLREIERGFNDAAVGAGADQPLGFGKGHETPEQIGWDCALEFG